MGSLQRQDQGGSFVSGSGQEWLTTAVLTVQDNGNRYVTAMPIYKGQADFLGGRKDSMCVIICLHEFMSA